MSSCIGADEYGAGCKSGSLINWCLNCISEDTHGTFCTNLRPSRSNTHHHAWIWTITYIIRWNGAAILQTRKKIMIRFIVLGGHNVVISPGIPPDSTSHVTARSTPPTILKQIQSQHSNRTLNQTTRPQMDRVGAILRQVGCQQMEQQIDDIDAILRRIG